jgi:predicted nucleic acid-binding protein
VQHEAGAAISELTLGELTKGAYFLSDGPKRQRILAWISEVVESFDDRVLALNRAVLFAWGQLCGTHEAMGRRWPVLDSLLAATALVHNLTIVTRNTDDIPTRSHDVDPVEEMRLAGSPSSLGLQIAPTTRVSGSRASTL